MYSVYISHFITKTITDCNMTCFVWYILQGSFENQSISRMYVYNVALVNIKNVDEYM